MFDVEGLSDIPLVKRIYPRKPPNQVPRVLAERDGGTGSFRIKHAILPSVVLVKPELNNQLFVQPDIIDAQLHEHYQVLGTEKKGDEFSSDSSF